MFDNAFLNSLLAWGNYHDAVVGALSLALICLAVWQNFDHLKKTLWRQEAIYWALGIIVAPLFLIALLTVYRILLNIDIANTTDIRGITVILAAILGAPFIIWRTWIAQRQSKTAEQGLITDRINKAVEQLGAEKVIWKDDKQSSIPNLEVRLGAIYALERIAQDSKRDHISVMEILCAYVRSNSPASGAAIIEVDTSKNGWLEKLHEDQNKITTAIDIQATLSVVGRRSKECIEIEQDDNNNPQKRKYELDLSNTNLQKLDLRWVNLSNAQLNGSNLQGANLGGATLENVHLVGANLQDTHLASAKICGSFLTSSKMQAADLWSADLRGVWLVATEMHGAVLNEATLEGTNFRDANLTGADLWNVTFDSTTYLSDTIFTFAATRHADFSDSDSICNEQVQSMFGDSTTQLPDGIEKPNWAEWDVDEEEYFDNWLSAKKKAGL